MCFHGWCICLPLLSASSPLHLLLYSAGHQQEGSSMWAWSRSGFLSSTVACWGSAWVSGTLPETTLTVTVNIDDLTWIEWHKVLLSAACPAFCLTKDSANRLALGFPTPLLPCGFYCNSNTVQHVKKVTRYSVSLFTGSSFANESGSESMINEWLRVGIVCIKNKLYVIM